MSQERKQFEKNLLLYGADLHLWPEGIRGTGLQTLEEFPGYQALVDEHRRFEDVLNGRPYEDPPGDLEERIIRASLPRPEAVSVSFRDIIVETLGWLGLGQPRAAVIALLFIFIGGVIFGVAIPIDSSADQEVQLTLRDHLTYYGEVL